MLSDQRSPYVGRFACDWHRLPGGDLPGNHRPRLKPGRIIATGGDRSPERSGGRQQAHLSHAGHQERPSAFVGGGPTREHVVDQHHPKRRPRHGPEGSAKRLSTGRSGPSRLRGSLDGATQELANGPAGELGHASRQRLGLIESARPLPAPPEWNPGDRGRLWLSPGRRTDGRRALERADHRGGERGRREPEPTELHPHQGPANGPLVEEGGASPGDRGRRAVGAALDVDLEGTAAPTASWWPEDGHAQPAGLTERPSPAAAPQAPPGEQDVEEHSEHARRGYGAAPTVIAGGPSGGARRQAQGSGTSSGSDCSRAETRTLTATSLADRWSG